MAWITIDDVEALIATDLSDDEWALKLIDQAQSLAEITVGVQTEPVSEKLMADLGA